MIKNNSILTQRAFQYFLKSFIFCITLLVIPTAHATYYYGGHHRGHHGSYYGSYRHYNSYPYNYRYRSHYPRSYSYSYSRPNYSSSYTPKNTSTTYSNGISSEKISTDHGWQLLSENKPAEAFKVFAEQAGRKQNDGIPKAGYALSVAMQGKYDKATWAMRRAFRIAPDSLHYINIDKTLKPNISTLIDEYNHRQSSTNNPADAAFMVAALNYLLHNNEAAAKAIDHAIKNEGDDSRSAENLHLLVQRDEPATN